MQTARLTRLRRSKAGHDAEVRLDRERPRQMMQIVEEFRIDGVAFTGSRIAQQVGDSRHRGRDMTLIVMELHIEFLTRDHAAQNQAPGAVQGVLNLVFFFYLVLDDVRRRLR